jgi:hypothetical protein
LKSTWPPQIFELNIFCQCLDLENLAAC